MFSQKFPKQNHSRKCQLTGLNFETTNNEYKYTLTSTSLTFLNHIEWLFITKNTYQSSSVVCYLLRKRIGNKLHYLMRLSLLFEQVFRGKNKKKISLLWGLAKHNFDFLWKIYASWDINVCFLWSKLLKLLKPENKPWQKNRTSTLL